MIFECYHCISFAVFRSVLFKRHFVCSESPTILSVWVGQALPSITPASDFNRDLLWVLIKGGNSIQTLSWISNKHFSLWIKHFILRDVAIFCWNLCKIILHSSTPVVLGLVCFSSSTSSAISKKSSRQLTFWVCLKLFEQLLNLQQSEDFPQKSLSVSKIPWVKCTLRPFNGHTIK